MLCTLNLPDLDGHIQCNSIDVNFKHENQNTICFIPYILKMYLKTWKGGKHTNIWTVIAYGEEGMWRKLKKIKKEFLTTFYN